MLKNMQKVIIILRIKICLNTFHVMPKKLRNIYITHCIIAKDILTNQNNFIYSFLLVYNKSNKENTIQHQKI